MLKIMVADDEGIVIEALRFIIENSLKEPYTIEVAKTGRQVIEVAEQFRPDIAFMDIQMPGINGVKAMQEIRKTNQDVIFIVVSAYEKFDYAKDAIAIGVLEYLNKPIKREQVVEVLYQAIDLVKQKRKKRENELEIQEKLETVLPVIEAGLVYTVMLRSGYSDEVENYVRLLEIDQTTGCMMVVNFGDSMDDGHLSNAIGSAVKNQKLYERVRTILKEYTGGAVGPMMGNNIIVFRPMDEEEDEYENRIKAIDNLREMVRMLKQETGAEYRVGVGAIRPLNEMNLSYQDALDALHESNARVAHIKDIPHTAQIEANYPIDVEKKLFAHVESGNKALVINEIDNLFDWMKGQNPDINEDARMKCMEFVLRAEEMAFDAGKMFYSYSGRHNYLPELMAQDSYSSLKDWFTEKIIRAIDLLNAKKKENTVDIIETAKQYINKNYRDVSLDSISRELNISPYYFSKIFKEKTGENFIDYLTDFKISKAKEMITENKMSMKEICIDLGYANPNYFSYMFKKKMGVTPSEYRDGMN